MSVLHTFCKLACAGSFGVCVLATGLAELPPLMAHAQTPGDSSQAKPKTKRGADKPTPAPAQSVAAAPATLLAPGPQPPPAGLIHRQPQSSAAAAKKPAPATGGKSKPQPTAARAAGPSTKPAAGPLRTSDAQPLAAASAKPKTPAPPSAAAPVTPVTPVTPAAPTKPACSIVEPEQPRGGRLEVVGEAFGAVPVVRISGKPARILERRSERVSVQIPADSNGGAITVQQEGRVLECGTLIIIGKNR